MILSRMIQQAQSAPAQESSAACTASGQGTRWLWGRTGPFFSLIRKDWAVAPSFTVSAVGVMS